MPRVAPVTRTVLPAIVIALLPCDGGFRAARLAAANTDQADPPESPQARLRLAATPGRPGRRLVQALPGSGAGEDVAADSAVGPCCSGRPNRVNSPGSVKATIRATPAAVTVSTCTACARYAPPPSRR